MRILIVRNFPSYMSVKNNTYNIQELGLAKALIRQGNECDIVFWTKDNEEEIIYEFDGDKSLKVYYRKGITALKNTFLKINDLICCYDVIQVCEYNQMQSWYLSKKYPSKVVIYHGPYYSDFNKNYNRMCKIFDILFLNAYKKNKTIFITKSFLAEDFLRKKEIKNIKTLGVGVDSQMLISEDIECDEYIYKTLLSDKNNIKLLYIGRIEERRNIEFLIDILDELSKDICVHLYLIGDGEESYVKKIEEYISNKSLGEKVIWQKKLEQCYMSLIYRNCDYFLLPTHYEIFGMVLLEAMYYGNCVLTTYNGGSATLVSNENNGFILEQNDLNGWVNVILDMEKNLSMKNNISGNASKTIKERFVWDKIAPDFINVYSEVLS